MKSGRRGSFLIVLLLVALPARVIGAAVPATVTLTVRVRHGAAPISSATVLVAGQEALTDERGEARFSLPAGIREVTVTHRGFEPVTVRIDVPSASPTFTVTVQIDPTSLESEVIVVSATRSGKVLEDQAIRVEALPEEEIEENLTLAPGDLTTLLNELGGLRVQTTGATLGGAGLRLQGLSGRYTQILLDELPLPGGRTDDLGLLQTPPLDLARVEVIKGVSSALYGGSALGGMVNLVSRRPGSEPELLLNRTSHGGTDAVGFVTGKLTGAWGYTLLGGGHARGRQDVDGDGWADLAGYRRAELRPRLFWDDGGGNSLFLTAGVSGEHRRGGTLGGAVTPAGTAYEEDVDTGRTDAGLVGRFLLQDHSLVTVRAAASGVGQDHDFGGVRERSLRSYALAEGALTRTDGRHTWVAGAVVQRDAYRARDLPRFDYTHVVPAVFAQDEYAPGEKVRLSGNARLDVDDVQGTVVSPLVSALVRPGHGLDVRLSAAEGYSAATPFTEETQVTGLSRVASPRDLEPERARNVSLDIGWSDARLELNGTLFASRVGDPLVLSSSPTQAGRLEILNAPGPTRTHGAELLARLTAGPLQMIATYTSLRSTESLPKGGGRRETPLVPSHAGEIACIWEKETRGRAGLEVSYTGAQRLEHDPYRSTGRAYVELNALAEVKIGEARLFVNGTNLTNVRQTRFDPLVLPAREPDGRWTTDVWAPLEGRAFNAGVKLEF